MKYLFCDRCGKRQEADENGFPIEEPFSQTSFCLRSPLDLCPACLEEYTELFRSWQLGLECWLLEGGQKLVAGSCW